MLGSNGADRKITAAPHIHQIFEAHVRRDRSAAAVVFREERLSYGELNSQANRLANYLRSLGVGPEVRVCVCMEPSAYIGEALLGILKAGGVYVPLDPTYPHDRLAAILEDTSPKIILTQAHLAIKLPATGADVFCFGRDERLLDEYSPDNLDLETDPDHTAYIVYTSGTTGKPKGVMISYGSLRHYIVVAQERYGFDDTTVMPAIARFTFSITFFELLNPLAAGGTLVILEREHVLDFKRLAATLESLTAIHASPSLLRRLLAHIEDNQLGPERFLGMKHASTGGDMVPPDVLEAMKRVFPNAEVYVIYGCSEVSCMAATSFVSRGREVTRTVVGSPFPDVSIGVFDDRRMPVPAGDAGEVYISGAGLAKGYLNRADLTEERFVVINGRRWYRTGDRGRLDAAGDLEILGRTDFQIKLNGIRIEPAEVEAHLRKIPGVSEAVAAKRELPGGDQCLAAFLVLDQTAPPAVSDIRRSLQTKLPDYMIPSAFVVLDALPVNVNQKVDRLALPQLDANSLALSAEYARPETALEKQIEEIWSEVLGVKDIGVNDGFFELGGQSLLAVQIASRLRELLEMEIPVTSLFTYPTIATLAEEIAAMQNRGNAEPSLSQIERVSRNERLPLSFSQQRVWFLNQLEGENGSYNIPVAIGIDGPLDLEALEKAIGTIAERHDALRTIIRFIDGEAFQVVLPKIALRVKEIDVRHISTTGQPRELQRLFAEEAQRPFDLQKAPLFRTTLFRTGPESHVFLLNFHHIIFDELSLERFIAELSELYSAILEKRPSVLPELQIQYADFARWQRRRITESVTNESHDYWRRQLDGAPAHLELSTAGSRPAIQTFRGRTHFFELDAELTQTVRNLSQRSGATLFMTLLGAFAALLSRYSQMEDIVVGCPIANRNRKELESLIGFFVNTLPIRIDLQGGPSFLELLRRVRETALGAYAHQEFPFEKIVEDLNPERSLSYSPLFQVMFVLQNAPLRDLDLKGASVRPLRMERGVSMFDLTLWITETDTGLNGEFEYNTDIFDRATIEQMAGHFRTLLKGITTDPDQRVSHLPLLGDRERHKLLFDGNNMLFSPRDGVLIHQLFETQADRTSDSVAVEMDREGLTYRELNERANRLAHHLRSMGAGPDVLVGICLDRSLEMLVALLGVLKAGGAYVALDPAYPTERIEYMLEDSNLGVIVTKGSLRDKIPANACSFVCLDTDSEAIGRHPMENLSNELQADDLAYVIYTSGSTGRPKGVQIPHKAVVNFLRSMSETPGMQSGDVLVAVTTISFDIAVLELFLPLTVGAKVVLTSKETASDANLLSRVLTESKATMMQATPVTWQLLLARGWQATPGFKILCGGEAMPRTLADKLLGLSDTVWNMYGPTETTIWSSIERVYAGARPVPIGKPIANTQLYIADPDALREGTVDVLPIGVPGELLIGGAGLARGYLNRPELTQEKFIPDPFSDDLDARLYRTGDLARYGINGEVEFLGRIDNQIKIRGFRIEPAEIETAACQFPGVRECVVIAREDERGLAQLTAYLVIDNASRFERDGLRGFLRSRLPDYMVPPVMVEIGEMPLTENGKVDRKALPAPDPAVRHSASEFLAPQTDTEASLAQIWAGILGVQKIGIRDNFFELGGHSLLAIRMFTEIEETFQKNIPLATLFEAGTIERLAEIIEHKEWAAPESCLVPIQPEGSNPPLFCVHAKGGNVLFYRALAQHLGTGQPLYGIQARRLGGRQIGHATVEEMAAYYIKEIQTLQPEGPYFLSGSSFGGLAAFEMARQLRAEGHEVALLALLDTGAPGYPKLLPETTLVRARFYRFVRRIQHHKDSLNGLSTEDRREYVRARLTKARTKAFRRINNLYKRTVRRLYVALEKPIPGDYVQLQDQIWRAAKNFKPQPYNGDMTLFRAKNQPLGIFHDPALGWKSLATGDLAIHEVPGHHGSILDEPYVRTLAEKLSACIENTLSGEIDLVVEKDTFETERMCGEMPPLLTMDEAGAFENT